MKGPDDSSLVTGLLYQHKGSTDTQLLGGLTNSIKLFNGAPITGFTYREENVIEDKLVSGLHVTGIVYQGEAGIDEQILRIEKIKGVIFRNRESAKRDREGESENVDASREASSLPEHGLLSGSQIVGMVCRDKGTGEERLITGATVDLKVLNGARIAGIIYEGTEGETIKRLTGTNITGLLLQQRNSNSEALIGDMFILGLIYKEKNALLEKLANSKPNAVSMAKTVPLYVVLILGILGLLLPVRKENDFSTLNFLVLPPEVMTALLVLMVIVPLVILVYGRYRRSRDISYI